MAEAAQWQEDRCRKKRTSFFYPYVSACSARCAFAVPANVSPAFHASNGKKQNQFDAESSPGRASRWIAFEWPSTFSMPR
jgi:hypothetical protein